MKRWVKTPGFPGGVPGDEERVRKGTGPGVPGGRALGGIYGPGGIGKLKWWNYIMQLH